MKLAEAFLFREVCVPKPNHLVNRELPSQVARYPPISKVHEPKVHRLQMLECLHIALLDQRSKLVKHFKHAWLTLSVIVLYVLYELVEAPEHISLDLSYVFGKVVQNRVCFI